LSTQRAASQPYLRHGRILWGPGTRQWNWRAIVDGPSGTGDKPRANG